MAGSGPVEAWLPAAGQPLAGPVRVQTRKETAFLHWGRVCRGLPASWEPAGAWAVGPAALGGAWASPMLQRILLTQHLPSRGCPAFQLNPNYEWV